MDDLIQFLIIAAACSALVLTGVWLIRKAKRGGKFAYAIGAGLMLFGMGNMRDPNNDTVQEAKRPKLKEEDDTGAPPADCGSDNEPHGP